MSLKRISEIAKHLGIDNYIEPYGKYKAKINSEVYNKIQNNKDGKLILVTAITPTKAGEGKTTTTVALVDGLNYIGESAIGVLREPSLGPVFGLKGGATGGGKVTVEPSDDINLHFTGDMHALTSSINLISAIIDNSIYQGNPLNINPEKITWTRALDMNDRTLRNITIAQGAKTNGIERKDKFTITVASELMAVMCLAQDETDFINRVNEIAVASTYDNKLIKIKDLKISKAIYKLMKDALKPNLVQTAENNPVIIHGGPFANIAHGCNSIIATKMGLKLADYVVTEAGFGADLGAEKFLDIKCSELQKWPDCIVLVATIRALKEHGNGDLKNGFINNLLHHYNVLKEKYSDSNNKTESNIVVAINKFADDTPEDLDELYRLASSESMNVCYVDGFNKGGAGAVDLANYVKLIALSKTKNVHASYNKHDTIKNKIESICKNIYGASNVIFKDSILESLESYSKDNPEVNDFYICMAKTPLSITDDPNIKTIPSKFDIYINDIKYYHGAKFIVPISGKVLLMPGLPSVPQAVKMEEE